jgi:hypothetical protein
MTRTPFLAALILMATVASEPWAVGPRLPAAAPHAVAQPHASAPHPSPTFSRPRPAPHPSVSHAFSAPHNGFVPRRPAAPIVHSRPQVAHQSRPAITARPTAPHVVNRPNTVNRPTVNQFNRNTNINRVGGNRTNVFNGGRANPYARGRFGAPGRRWAGGGRQVGAAATWFSRPGNWGRTWWGGSPAWYWGQPWYWQHAHWHHGFWNYWAAPPALWFGAGLASGWLFSPYDTAAYFNPYFAAPAVPVGYLNYAVPLPAVPAEEDALAFPPDPDTLTDPNAPPIAPTEGPAADANRLIGDAQAAFKAGDYAKVGELVDAAIKVTPSDPTLHEFRALTMFAQGNYQDDAATLYAVLTSGPGWDWPTMRDMYPDVATYTAQLRALEKFVGANPTAAFGHFGLAYQYLVTGAKDAAIRELQQVVKLQPDDKLSQGLLTSLTGPATNGDANPPPMPGR